MLGRSTVNVQYNTSEATKMRQFMILLVNLNSAIELGVLLGFFVWDFLRE